MEYKWKANCSSRLFTKQLRKAGHHLNEMFMPNLSLFFAWCFLSLVMKGVSGDLHATLEEVCHWMIQLLLPILISYSGGKSVGGQKGAVAGAIASLGLIARSDAPQIVGAMIIGPLAGFLYEQFVSRFHAKFKAGYEMLVSNLLVGLIGSVICIIGIVFIEPALNSFHLLLVSVVSWLVKMNLLPLVSLILEPLKVLLAILSQLAKKEKKQFVILKEPIEQLKIQEETIYIAQRELAVNEQLKETIPQLVLVEHWVATNEYEKLVKGEK